MLDEATRAALREAGQAHVEALAARDAVIRAAVLGGGSLREVADAVGLSHMAVKFIAYGRPKKS